MTGAASGIGRAATEILVALGAPVVGVDVQPIEIDGVDERHLLDLSDADAVREVAHRIGAPVHALFNCAGIPGTAQARTIMAVNFAGMRAFTEQLIPEMPTGSAICCVGSTAAVNWTYHIAALRPVVISDLDGSHEAFERALDWFDANLAELGYPYDVSKEAVNVYIASRAIALNDIGVRINCVNPGGTFTPASREFTKAVKAKRGGAEMIEHWPRLLGRMARPDEQAWAMVFLNSPYASFVNGASLFVDAGLTSGMFTGMHHPSVAAGMFWTPPIASGNQLEMDT